MKLSPEIRPHFLPAVLERIVRPLVRLALARRMPFQVFSDLLKKAYVSVATEEFVLNAKKLTDSRLSVLTGLQRKDIKAIRAALEEAPSVSPGVGPLARVLAHWRSASGYQEDAGTPLPLQKTGPAPSFESLVGLVSRDVHPRTMLDDLLALGLVTSDEEMISLVADAFVPRADEEVLFGYLSANLGDHASAAVRNVLAAPDAAPHFERAVHYNHLSPDALDELDALSRRLQQSALEKINAKALELQNRDKVDATATGRFRCGAFILCEPSTKKDESEPTK